MNANEKKNLLGLFRFESVSIAGGNVIIGEKTNDIIIRVHSSDELNPSD